VGAVARFDADADADAGPARASVVGRRPTSVAGAAVRPPGEPPELPRTHIDRRLVRALGRDVFRARVWSLMMVDRGVRAKPSSPAVSPVADDG